MRDIPYRLMMKFDERHFVCMEKKQSVGYCLMFLALICPSSDSTIPDPDCFRMAREHAWDLIEQKFVFINLGMSHN